MLKKITVATSIIAAITISSLVSAENVKNKAGVVNVDEANMVMSKNCTVPKPKIEKMRPITTLVVS